MPDESSGGETGAFDLCLLVRKVSGSCMKNTNYMCWLGETFFRRDLAFCYPEEQVTAADNVTVTTCPIPAPTMFREWQLYNQSGSVARSAPGARGCGA